ncbi:GT2 family glycosyltransferase [Arthrobacter sp. CAN_A212]|uniref:glycosyltransferase family 2 protein n=1 Tax=Arthrobacter sp. CAN_A212 TaxID=2787719 RepID=UPI001A1E8BB2
MAISSREQMVIAVLTYRRPDDLAVALPELISQVRSSSIPATILVIDNDPDAGARALVEGKDRELVRYVHEPVPGIAAARSRALAEAREMALLVFIDDDELPSRGWLDLLVEVQRSTGAAAVVGPVISEYVHPPERWIMAGEFFIRRRMPTGTVVTVAATNNLLLDLNQVRAMGLDFDLRFGLLGGEDTLFTRLLVQRGGKIVWCDEAIVMDRVPAQRLTRSWVLRRAFSSGNSWSRVDLELASGSHGSLLVQLRSRLKLLAAGLVRIGGGCVRGFQGLVTGSVKHRAKGLRTIARGAGMVSGAVGYVYREYRRAQPTAAAAAG